MKAQHIILATMMVVLVSACDRAGEEVQLQEGDRLPQTNKSEKQRNRLVTIQYNGQAVTVDTDCTRAAQPTEAQANDPGFKAQLIEACDVEKRGGKGFYGSSYSIWLGYWYPQDYYNYSYSGFGCNLFFGSYASSWNTNCASTWGGYQPNWYWGNNWNYGNNYCYNYYTGYNSTYGTTSYNSNNGYYYPSMPSYCYYRYY